MRLFFEALIGTRPFIRMIGSSVWNQCGSDRCGQKQALTHEYVAEQFEKRGCQLLDTYTRSRTPMRFICRCGNEGRINWNNFHTKQRYYAACGLKNRSGENHYEWIGDREAKRAFDEFRQRCYKTLKSALKCSGLKKNARTEEILGYSIAEFKNHIESHPNWPNVKGKRWHVDHIFPIKAFAEYGIKDIKIINSLDNLQPLLYNLNISKSDKYDAKAFGLWLESKGIKT
jgi:hypothetical protein